jgi:hypothetical protein
MKNSISRTITILLLLLVGLVASATFLLNMSYQSVSADMSDLASSPGESRPASESYGLSKQVIAAGGGRQSSTTYQLVDTFGQPVASGSQPLTSTSYSLAVGFWSQLPTPEPTPTPSPTYTPTPNAGSTGFLSPTIQQSNAGGDGNGYESSPTNAFSDDGIFASDNNSGTGAGGSCTNSGKDRHRFHRYNFNIPLNATITGIQVRLDAMADSTLGSPKLCVQLSWDGGASWTAMKTTTTLGTVEATYLLGSPADNWGHNWSVGELSNNNFRLRITDVATDNNRDFFLDWVAVNIYYESGASATFTPTPTGTSTPTGTPITPTPTPTPGSSFDTGLISPQSNAVAGGGDRNGFQTNPTDAYQENGLFAVDADSGTSTSTDCLHSSKDRHRFYSFPITLPAGALVTGIQVRLDAKADSAANVPQMCVQLSWDGGTNWTAIQLTPMLGTDKITYLLGGPGDTWGRSWNTAELAGTSFQVRITNVSSAATRDFYLDWVAVRVYYQ